MKKRDDVLVGIVMAVAIVVAIVGSLWLARGGLSKGYPLYAKFPWSAGLKQGQPVLLGGVNIGYVDEVDLRPNGTVLTTFRVGKEYHVPQGTTATVVANGIFGDMAIALTPKGPNPVSIPPGDTVPVGPSGPGIAAVDHWFWSESGSRRVNSPSSHGPVTIIANVPRAISWYLFAISLKPIAGARPSRKMLR